MCGFMPCVGSCHVWVYAMWLMLCFFGENVAGKSIPGKEAMNLRKAFIDVAWKMIELAPGKSMRVRRMWW